MVLLCTSYYDYSIFLASFSSFFIPSTSILGYSVHELENCMVHLWTPVEWLCCVQREVLIEPEPDLPVFCLLSRTRPHKFRDPTFWKKTFSGSPGITILQDSHRRAYEKGSKGQGPVPHVYRIWPNHICKSGAGSCLLLRHYMWRFLTVERIINDVVVHSFNDTCVMLSLKTPLSWITAL